MKRLTLALLFCAAPLAAQSDSGLLKSPSAARLLGEWSADAKPRAFCLLHYHDYGAAFVIDSIVPIDSTTAQWCKDGDGLVPLVIDHPRCPPPSFTAAPFPFVLVRCEAGSWRRINRKTLQGPSS